MVLARTNVHINSLLNCAMVEVNIARSVLPIGPGNCLLANTGIECWKQRWDKKDNLMVRCS